MSLYGDNVLADVVAAFMRSIRAMGYYDEHHPVFEATRREAHAAIELAFRSLAVVTLGGGGHHLIVDEDGGVLNDPASAALARRFFDNAVIAVRLHPGVRPEDVGLLMQVLAEREDRVRAAGGVSAVLEQRGTMGIEVLEVDIDALFAGRQGEVRGLAGADPVAELALKAILRFRNEEREAGGEALQVSLERVSSAGSLGGFLDELLGQAEPGVVAGAAGGGGLTGDDLADLASQAFLQSHEAISRSGQSTTELAQSAEILSNALVRLSPDARFALLRKLAGAEEASEAREAAARDLGARLDDRAVTAAIASALFDQQGDPATVRAIGNLIRRIRPVEAERQRLLATVDQDMHDLGRPIDGVLWQEIQSRALEDSSLGLLEMSLVETRVTLQEYAHARRAGRLRPVDGQDVLHTVDARMVEHWTTHALVELLGHPGRLGPGAVEACRYQLERLDEDGANDECMLLVQSLMRRADGDTDPELTQLLLQLLDGPRGARWSLRLLQHEGRPSQMMAEILLAALDRPGDRAYKAALIERLARLDREGLLRLTGRLGLHVSPLQAQSLIRAAMQRDALVGVKVARMLLRNPHGRVREVVLKTVVERPDRDVVALLAHVAGWKGDKYTKALLGLDGTESRAFILRMQLTAIGALGLTRSGMAAGPLYDILLRSRFFNDREQDELRVAAAQALRTNASPEATSALEDARQHRKRVIRETVQRVLGKGASR